jgi:ABC-type sugar transport system ATPase subunit
VPVAETPSSPRAGRPGHSPRQARLAARSVSVSFGGVTVLRDAAIEVAGGEILGLLGANGSGKSTLVKVLTGVYRADPGASLTVNDATIPVDSFGPLGARAAGVRVVHQEAPLIGQMTVAETIALDIGFPTRASLIQGRRLRAEAERTLAGAGVDLDPDRVASGLTAGERATLSFALALADVDTSRAVLILDEATASLSTADAERFLDRVRAEVDKGLAVVMVTHRLPEVRRYCDWAMVLSDGEVAASGPAAEFDERRLVRAMVGRHPKEREVEPAAPEAAADLDRGGGTLKVTGLRGRGIHGVDFSLSPGEILGVGGRAEGGASELLRMLAGIDPREGGEIELDGTRIGAGGPRSALVRGIAYISPDRLSEGGVPNMTVAENLILPQVDGYWMKARRAKADVARMIELLDVRPANPDALFDTLSGGNQQKVLIARWLLMDPRVLVLDDPTAGVDPNTREVLFSLLRRSADEGLSIVIRSTEPEQLARLCDRVIVLRDGVVVEELAGGLEHTEEISLATYA